MSWADVNIETAIKAGIRYCYPQDFSGRPVILEAGIANGDDTLQFCKIMPNSEVFGFEPDPRYHAEIYNRLGNFLNFNFDKRALSDETSTKPNNFYLADRVSEDGIEKWGSSSLLLPTGHKEFHKDIKFSKTVTVNTITLDDWASEKNIDKIDVMWLDLQGSEPDVLRNCKILETVDMIWSEVNLIELYENCMLYEDFKLLMASKGFQVILEHLPWKDSGNVLFGSNRCAQHLKAVFSAFGDHDEIMCY